MSANPTILQKAVLHCLVAYDEARFVLDREQRKVLRSILASRLAKDIVDEEFDTDRAEDEAAA